MRRLNNGNGRNNKLKLKAVFTLLHMKPSYEPFLTLTPNFRSLSPCVFFSVLLEKNEEADYWERK